MLGPRVHSPYSISIGSVAFAELTVLSSRQANHGFTEHRWQWAHLMLRIACLRNAWIWNKNFKAVEIAWKQIRCLKVLENPWKVLECKSCKFWNFAFVDKALVCMSPVLGNSIWFHFACLHLLLQYGLQTNWWRQSVTCFYHYGIGEYSTVHFSVTLQSKFWMSASRIWLFVDNFGAWKMQFVSLKVLEKCLNFVLWVCYEPWRKYCFAFVYFLDQIWCYSYLHTFNGPLSRTTQVGRYQKSKTNLDFTEAKDSEWQWH